MVRKQIHVVLYPHTMMGRGILAGIAAYAHGRQDWRLNTWGAVQLGRGQTPSPDTADAVIGGITPTVAEAWQGADRCRVVNVSRAMDVPGAANVTCDDGAIARMVAEYLLGKGLECFGWMGPERVRRRYDDFAATLRRHGHEVSKLVPRPGHYRDDIATWLKGFDSTCGVMAFNDLKAMDLIDTAEDLGIGVPERLAVAGVDNDELVTMFAPVGVTSVDPNFFEVGRRAAEVLDSLLEGGAPPERPIRIPPKGIIERESTDFPGDLDPLAVQAARLIRREALTGANIADIADRLPVARRTAVRRFRAAFGRSMLDEITRVRLAEAKRLLSDAEMPVERIASRTGYASAAHFSKAFSKHVGMSPSRYRSQTRGSG